MEVVPLAGIGIVSGLLAGMLGIGGGVVIVPALILIYEFTARHAAADITVIAVATSMACIIFTSFSAAYTQFRAGKVKFELVIKLVPFFILGSFAAGISTPLFDAALLRALIGLFLMFVAIVMLANWRPNPSRGFPGHLGSSTIGLTGGYVSGMAGIAGGNVIVPTFVYFNVPMHNATATSSTMGVPIALAGATGYALGTPAMTSEWMLGLIDLKSWFAITLSAIICAPLGVKIAHRVAADTLKRVFGGFLALVSIRMLYSSLGL